ncbi:unnamed protein product [Eruca vesicaria subsp. sativa]|uniref:F-box associated beta-propeller type 1 domain-containing protein n=1 Tax=Eruca vesicaria subsp. sativa TaxID=29727 RepID=A0ABC8MAF9_ERUVS|nr:unnamed protein product [Eruca vesicaria subsp. sativa]
MDSLPGHLLDKVLFKTDLRALAMLCCTNTSLQSHIQNPSFVSEYYSQIKSSLLHTSTRGSVNIGYYNPHDDSRSLKIKRISRECRLLGYCSGLLLLYFIDDRLCVTNPVRKKFRFLTLSNHMRYDARMVLGLAVDQTDRTTKSFKVVCIFKMAKTDETRYGFDINAGDSWTLSKTTLACHKSNLDYSMKNPIYVDGSLHWLRNDGSIIAFNPETEQARLIQIELPHGLSSRTVFASIDNSLTLVSANEEVICVYSLKNILSDPKWVLMKQIHNGVIKKIGVEWYIEAYNSKCIVLRGDQKNTVQFSCARLVYMYDLIDNKWVAMGSVPTWSYASLDFILFTPSPSSVVGLDEILACGDRNISSLRLIMGLVDGSSSEKVENKLGRMSVEE